MRTLTRHLVFAVPAVLALAALVGTAGGEARPSGPAPETLTLEEAVAGSQAGALPSSTAARARTAATWCGASATSDLAPNVLAGYPLHWFYALPADGTDQLAAVASRMQTDAEEIDAWWRGQDPTRAPRNDVTQLPCGVQLDITSVRMQSSGAQLATDRIFSSIFGALEAAGFRSRFLKAIVYYDGPVANARICGQGGTEPSGFGLAVIYVRACGGVSTAVVAAHELLHSFGAVPFGAPNECPDPDGGHTCDDPTDLLYPFIDATTPLSAKTLDPGRNDYYGHPLGLIDAQDTPWLVQLDRQVPVEVAVAGPGRVEADVPGVLCAQSCTTTWNDGTRITLTGVPANGAKLVRWGGACGGASLCNLATTAGASVTALFAPLTYRLGVTISGSGTVRSNVSGITCRPRCAAAFPSFAPVRLTAKPAKGWRLRQWRGACTGTRLTCTVRMSAAASARAVFVRR